MLPVTEAEGAGAVCLAALIGGSIRVAKGSRVVLVVSAGNLDSPLLGRIISQGLIKHERIMRFRVRRELEGAGGSRIQPGDHLRGFSIFDFPLRQRARPRPLSTVHRHLKVLRKPKGILVDGKMEAGLEVFVLVFFEGDVEQKKTHRPALDLGKVSGTGCWPVWRIRPGGS